MLGFIHILCSLNQYDNLHSEIQFKKFLNSPLIRSEQKKTEHAQKLPINKKSQLLSNLDETWWKKSSHEAIILTKFYKIWRNFVDFLSMANFWMCPRFFFSDFSSKIVSSFSYQNDEWFSEFSQLESQPVSSGCTMIIKIL